MRHHSGHEGQAEPDPYANRCRWTPRFNQEQSIGGSFDQRLLVDRCGRGRASPQRPSCLRARQRSNGRTVELAGIAERCAKLAIDLERLAGPRPECPPLGTAWFGGTGPGQPPGTERSRRSARRGRCFRSRGRGFDQPGGRGSEPARPVDHHGASGQSRSRSGGIGHERPRPKQQHRHEHQPDHAGERHRVPRAPAAAGRVRQRPDARRGLEASRRARGLAALFQRAVDLQRQGRLVFRIRRALGRDHLSLWTLVQ